MNKKLVGGIILLVISILLLSGGIFEFCMASSNQSTYEKNKRDAETLGIPYQHEEDDKKTVAFQNTMGSICTPIGIVLLLVGVALILKSRKMPISPQQYLQPPPPPPQ